MFTYIIYFRYLFDCQAAVFVLVGMIENTANHFFQSTAVSYRMLYLLRTGTGPFFYQYYSLSK